MEVAETGPAAYIIAGTTPDIQVPDPLGKPIVYEPLRAGTA